MENDQVTEDKKRLAVHAGKISSMPTKDGQYLNLSIPPRKLARSFAPDDLVRLEFYRGEIRITRIS